MSLEQFWRENFVTEMLIMLAVWWFVAGLMVFATRPVNPLRRGWRRWLP